MARSDSIESRKRANMELRRENLRQELKGKAYLKQIDSDYDALVELERKVKNAKVATLNPVLSKAETQRRIIQTRLDINFKRLAKVLPDIKSIELADPGGGSFVDAFAAVMGRKGTDS